MFPTKIFLAPLAGTSDLAFRLIAREHGAKFCFFEMVDANSLIHGPSKNTDILKTIPSDQPIAAQLLGSDPDDTLKAAKKLLQQVNPLFLDLNAACPVKKAIKKKSGAYLVHDPAALCAIIKKLAVKLDLPITVKLRIGYNSVDQPAIVKTAVQCQQSGAQALFVHGRTMKQSYSGRVDYQTLKMIKAAVTIPVFGSGDVFSPELAKHMLDETGCDGVLVARGAMGHPWIFKDIADYLATGSYSPMPDWPARRQVLLRHLAYLDKYKESRPLSKLGIMRRVAIMYVSSMRNAAKLRGKITSVRSYEDLLQMIETFI